MIRAALGIALLATLLAPTVGAESFFIPLGDISGGDFRSRAHGVSGDGSTVVGWGNKSEFGANDVRQAVKWSIDRETGTATLIALPDLPETSGPACEFSEASAASEDGNIVVGTGCSGCINDDCFAFGIELEVARWTGTTVENLGNVPSGPVAAAADDVSADGATVVGTGLTDLVSTGPSDPPAGEGFMVSPPVALQGLGGEGQPVASTVSSVAADSSVLAGAAAVSDPDPDRAFFFSPASWTSAGGWDFLPTLPGALTPAVDSNDGFVNGITPDGLIFAGVVLSSITPLPLDRLLVTNEAYRYTEGDSSLMGLGQLLPCDPFVFGDFDFCGSTAYAVSGDGKIVVGASDSSLPPDPMGSQAFIWHEGEGIRSLTEFVESDLGLDLSGWTLHDARGISDDGRTIAGFGTNPSGNTEAFVVVVPEPAAGASSLVGLATVAGLMQTRRRGRRAAFRTRT